MDEGRRAQEHGGIEIRFDEIESGEITQQSCEVHVRSTPTVGCQPLDAPFSALIYSTSAKIGNLPMAVKTIQWNKNRVVMLDQRLLPEREVYRSYRDYTQVAQAIRDMVIRGAPAIGVAAAMGVALGALWIKGKNFDREIERIFRALAKTRPTAVNLFWALERMRRVYIEKRSLGIEAVQRLLKEEALRIFDEDIAANRLLGKFGAKLLGNSRRVMTHCNAGALATAGYGTALGVIRAMKEAGKEVEVLDGETRPFLQGARLTAWELKKDRIPVTLLRQHGRLLHAARQGRCGGRGLRPGGRQRRRSQ